MIKQLALALALALDGAVVWPCLVKLRAEGSPLPSAAAAVMTSVTLAEVGELRGRPSEACAPLDGPVVFPPT